MKKTLTIQPRMKGPTDSSENGAPTILGPRPACLSPTDQCKVSLGEHHLPFIVPDCLDRSIVLKVGGGKLWIQNRDSGFADSSTSTQFYSHIRYVTDLARWCGILET
jgi:hypothetical protein